MKNIIIGCIAGIIVGGIFGFVVCDNNVEAERIYIPYGGRILHVFLNWLLQKNYFFVHKIV